MIHQSSALTLSLNASARIGLPHCAGCSCSSTKTVALLVSNHHSFDGLGKLIPCHYFEQCDAVAYPGSGWATASTDTTIMSRSLFHMTTQPMLFPPHHRKGSVVVGTCCRSFSIEDTEWPHEVPARSRKSRICPTNICDFFFLFAIDIQCAEMI